MILRRGLQTGFAALVLAAVVDAQGNACSVCGPGPHWIHSPQCISAGAGTDLIPNEGAVVGIDSLLFDGNLDCSVDHNLVLSPCSVLRVSRSAPMTDSLNFPGLRPADGHLDVIDTEILELCLTGGGITLRAGAGLGQGGVLSPSFGAVAEQPGDPTLADSFFDVFFEVDLGGGNFAYNQTALTIVFGPHGLNCLPPAGSYVHPTGCLPLFTSPAGGAHVANLVSAQHNVNLTPVTCVPSLPRWGLPVVIVGLALAALAIVRRGR